MVGDRLLIGQWGRVALVENCYAPGWDIVTMQWSTEGSRPTPLVDFQSTSLRGLYTGHEIDPDWIQAFKDKTGRTLRRLGDLGSGGGLYSEALSQSVSELVISIDIAEGALADSSEGVVSGGAMICPLQSECEALAVQSQSLDALVCRALIHHLPNLRPTFVEASRVLKRGGYFWVQDRTPEDVDLPGSPEHLRGWYLDVFPHLRKIELSRRHKAQTVVEALESSGFESVSIHRLFETRRHFDTPDALTNDIVMRRGRSLLFALSDEEVAYLAQEICSRVIRWPVIERDRWTVWLGTSSWEA